MIMRKFNRINTIIHYYVSINIHEVDGLPSNDVMKIPEKSGYISKREGSVNVIIDDNVKGNNHNIEKNTELKNVNKSYRTSLVLERITAYKKAFGKKLCYETEEILDPGGDTCGMRVII